MVIFAAHLGKRCLKVRTDSREHAAQPFNRIAIEYFAPIFCYKDQMYVHLKNAVPAVSNVVVMCYSMHMKRTNYYFPEQLLLRLKKAKEMTGIPVSEIIRRAVESYLEQLGL